MHYYSPENAQTSNGFLNISTIRKVNEYRAFNEKTKKFYGDKKYVQSAMLQGWNKFCFTGGIVEFSAKLPGKHDVGGLWPARKLYCVEFETQFVVEGSNDDSVTRWLTDRYPVDMNIFSVDAGKFS